MRRFRLAPRGGQNGTRPGFRAIQHGECALGALEDRFCLPGRCVRIGCREIYNDNFPGRYAPEPCKWCKKAHFFPALRAGRPTTRCFYTYSICVYSPVLQPGFCPTLACTKPPRAHFLISICGILFGFYRKYENLFKPQPKQTLHGRDAGDYP